MALHGITLLPLIKCLQKEYPEVLQPWYADDGAMQGAPIPVAECFKLLEKVGPMFSYYLGVEKSWGICTLADEAESKAVFAAAGLEVQWTRGHHYVGGSVSSDAMRDCWIEPKIEGWVFVVEELAKVAVKYPQSAYAGFTHFP